MKIFSITLSFFGAVLTLAAPTSSSNQVVTVTRIVDSESTQNDWSSNWTKSFPIHNSCNNSQYNQLSKGLEEAQVLAAHARDHTLKFGKKSRFYEKYFKDAPTATVIGWYDSIVNAEKSDVLFRCDNIDGNCDNEGWAGHWRGTNATNETVICDLSYTTRLYLFQMCSQGYTVSKSKNTLFWAGDLLHRIWHTTLLGQDTVGHYADTYEECLELANTNNTEAINNSASLRYYALDVYAYDIAIPGEGCSGESESRSTSSDTETSTTTAKSSESSIQGGSECHTHENGETHCV